MLNSSERTSALWETREAGDAEHEGKDADIPALQQLWTPPRGAGGENANGYAATPGATVLSLATVLPDAPIANTPSKPLHLAEHLERQQIPSSTNVAVLGASPSINPSNVAT